MFERRMRWLSRRRFPLVVAAGITIYVIHAGYILFWGPTPAEHDGMPRPALEEDDVSAVRRAANALKVTPAKVTKPKVRTTIHDPDAPGEMNEPVIINVTALSPEQRVEYDAGWTSGYNLYAGDKISVHRRLPDFREPGCLENKYRPYSEMPSTSIIVIFNNEQWTTLLRTVHSCLDRAPPQVIKELILLDDYSDLPHLGRPLDDYMARVDKVRIVRTGRREGSIRGRNLAGKAATGEVLMYLDSHCECAEGWLEPMLDRVAANRTTVVMPPIDSLDSEDLAFRPARSNSIHQGGFNWGLAFSWHLPSRLDQSMRKQLTDPFRTPVQPGGIFLIDKAFFAELGYLDPGLETWGADNMELSFKVWMCGGSIEVAPCSHIGHIYRMHSPIKWANTNFTLDYNNRRVAEVWMDEYKQYYYDTLPVVNKMDIGDISDRLAIRERMRCKSFDWYIKNIYPDQFIPGEAIAKGEIRNRKRQMCMDSLQTYVTARDCLQGTAVPKLRPGHSQYWFMTQIAEVMRESKCMDYADQFPGIKYDGCHKMGGHQAWAYRENGEFYHAVTNKCAAMRETGNEVLMVSCTGDDLQKWDWQRA